MARLIEDEVLGDVPDAAGDGDAGENEAQLGDIAVQLTEVTLVVALATLVVDDEQTAIGEADNTVGAYVLNAVLGPQGVAGSSDGALAIDRVGRIEPGGDSCVRIQDGAAHVGIDAVYATGVVRVVGGDDTMLEGIVNHAVHIAPVIDTAHQAMQPQSGVNAGTGSVLYPDAQLHGNIIDGIASDGSMNNPRGRFFLLTQASHLLPGERLAHFIPPLNIGTGGHHTAGVSKLGEQGGDGIACA